jgi:cellulose synthase/poly-beta-1,6-N-acetylglucosamine synthase-like glycosyltransferase
MNDFLFYLVIVAGILNLIRMAAYLFSSDIHTIKAAGRKPGRQSTRFPTVTIVVPAHNEERVIVRTLDSLYNTKYPASKLEVIIADDGSTDSTAQAVRRFRRTHRDRCRIRLIRRPNRGKASVLNYAIQRHARGELIMCLDADSYLLPDSLSHAVAHFRDRQVLALSSNVNVIEDSTLLSLIQRFEYIVCYHMKRGQAQWGAEYIIGGIGSMFRRSMLQKVSYYDTNTMTEDIDLTFKILVNKSKREKIVFAADSIVYTEAVHSLGALMRQRYRWKYGRNQTYLKNRPYFFSKDARHSRIVSWFMLPFSIFQDMMFLFEPLIIAWFIYLAVAFGDTLTLVTAIIVMSTYVILNIWSSLHLSFRSKLRLSLLSPLMYFMMFVLTFAEYYALIKALILLPKLKQSIQRNEFTWKSPERSTPA